MTAVLIFSVSNESVEPLVLKTDKLSDLDSYISKNYNSEDDIICSKEFGKDITKFYSRNGKVLDNCDFGSIKILCFYKEKDDIKYEYVEPIYDKEVVKKLNGKSFFKIDEKKYLKNRKNYIKEKEYVKK